jgi:hypothetical protein
MERRSEEKSKGRGNRNKADAIEHSLVKKKGRKREKAKEAESMFLGNFTSFSNFLA